MKRLLALAILALLYPANDGNAQLKHIAAGYSAVSATQTGFYIAKDAKLFEKYGLFVDPVYVPGGSRMAQAIIAGEFPLALAGGNIVNVNLSGGDIVIIGGVVNVPSFYLFVQPAVKRNEDLKGKAIGVTRYGASTDVSLRAYLKKYGLEPDRDVKIIQMGGQPEIVAGMSLSFLDHLLWNEVMVDINRAVGHVLCSFSLALQSCRPTHQNAPAFSNSMRYRLSIISWGLIDFARGSIGAISSSDACNAASLISRRLSRAGISD